MINDVGPRRAPPEVETSPSSTMATLAARSPLIDSNVDAAISHLLDFTAASNKDGRAAIAGRRAACVVPPPPAPPPLPLALAHQHRPTLQQQLLNLQPPAAQTPMLPLSEGRCIPAGRRRNSREVERGIDFTLTGARGDGPTAPSDLLFPPAQATPRKPRAADTRPLWLRSPGGAENERR